MRKSMLTAIVVFTAYVAWDLVNSELQVSDFSTPEVAAPGASSPDVSSAGDSNDFVAVLKQAFENKQSNVQVTGEGRVVGVLSDDNDGSRHQRFILEFSSGQTVLVAHNIDLAPRIASIKQGETVSFNGEYEWNPQGGVIHWTHHDPSGSHEDGWLRHKGRTYQ